MISSLILRTLLGKLQWLVIFNLCKWWRIYHTRVTGDTRTHFGWHAFPEPSTKAKNFIIQKYLSLAFFCEIVFSVLNNIETNKRDRLIDEVSIASLALNMKLQTLQFEVFYKVPICFCASELRVFRILTRRTQKVLHYCSIPISSALQSLEPLKLYWKYNKSSISLFIFSRHFLKRFHLFWSRTKHTKDAFFKKHTWNN